MKRLFALVLAALMAFGALPVTAFAGTGIVTHTGPDGTEYYMDTAFNEQDLYDIFYVQAHSRVGEIQFCFWDDAEGKQLENRFRTDASFRHALEAHAGILECTYSYLTINDMCVVYATYIVGGTAVSVLPGADAEKVQVRSGLGVYSLPGEQYLREYNGILNSGEHLAIMVTVKNTASEARSYSNVYFRVDGGDNLVWAGLKLDAGAERECHIYKGNMDKLSPGSHHLEFFINNTLVFTQTVELPAKASCFTPTPSPKPATPTPKPVTPSPAPRYKEVDPHPVNDIVTGEKLFGISSWNTLSSVRHDLNALFGTDLSSEKTYAYPDHKTVFGIPVESVSIEEKDGKCVCYRIYFEPDSMTPQKFTEIFRTLLNKFGDEQRGTMRLSSPAEEYRVPTDADTILTAERTGREVSLSPKWTHTELRYNLPHGSSKGSFSLTYYRKDITIGFTADHFPDYGKSKRSTPTPSPTPRTITPSPSPTPAPVPIEAAIYNMEDLVARYNTAMYAMEENFTFTFADTQEARRLMDRWKTDSDFRCSLAESAGMYSTYTWHYVEPSRTMGVTVYSYYPGVRIAQAWATGDFSFLSAREQQTYYAAQAMISEVSQTSAGKKDMQKALLDKLHKTVKYDNATYNSHFISEYIYENDTAIGALLDRKADCDGFADAYYLMLNMLGESVRYIHMWDPTGRNIGHMANLIIDWDTGNWVFADACWGKYKMTASQAKKTYKSKNYIWDESITGAIMN